MAFLTYNQFKMKDEKKVEIVNTRDYVEFTVSKVLKSSSGFTLYKPGVTYKAHPKVLQGGLLASSKSAVKIAGEKKTKPVAVK